MADHVVADHPVMAAPGRDHPELWKRRLIGAVFKDEAFDVNITEPAPRRSEHPVADRDFEQRAFRVIFRRQMEQQIAPVRRDDPAARHPAHLLRRLRLAQFPAVTENLPERIGKQRTGSGPRRFLFVPAARIELAPEGIREIAEERILRHRRREQVLFSRHRRQHRLPLLAAAEENRAAFRRAVGDRPARFAAALRRDMLAVNTGTDLNHIAGNRLRRRFPDRPIHAGTAVAVHGQRGRRKGNPGEYASGQKQTFFHEHSFSDELQSAIPENTAEFPKCQPAQLRSFRQSQFFQIGTICENSGALIEQIPRE